MVYPILWLIQAWMTLSEWEKEGRRFGKRQCILRKVSTGVEWCDATKYYLLSHVICYLVKEGREKWKEEWRDRGRRKKGKIRKDERGRKGRAGKGKKGNEKHVLFEGLESRYNRRISSRTSFICREGSSKYWCISYFQNQMITGYKRP